MITNFNNISLSLAVWLVNDDYDYVYQPNYISVTTLMKPLKQLIMSRRVKYDEQKSDVLDYVNRALGNAVHDSIEKAWVTNYRTNLEKLGYGPKTIDRIKINPDPSTVTDDDIPVYIEQRIFREFNGYTIGGKFDLVAEGHVEDNKSTSAFNWLYGTRDEEHILQTSLYRWIDSVSKTPIITEDFMRVNYVFTDWQKMSARTNPAYPQARVLHKDHELTGLPEIESWVEHKLEMLEKYAKTPQDQLPPCTDEDLWRSDPKFKYYSDPEKAKDPTARSTKNFETLADAAAFKAEKGKGVVVTVPGEVKRCPFCPAYDICNQRREYFPDD